MGVITPVTQPTPWVSNMLVVEKNNPQKDLRVCIDPQYLNQAIMIPKYHIPKTDDVFAQLNGMSVFSVIDMSMGFWHLELDDESSLLTTFQTPFGQFRWTRLCFGVSSAPEIFMQKIMEIFGDIPGCVPYFDDLIIGGKDEREHDEIVSRVIDRAIKFNVKFNRDKVQFKKEKVKVLGVIVTKDSIQVDPERISAINNFSVPKDKKGVLRFLGFIKYVALFIPCVSSRTEHLQNLTRKDVPFVWTLRHDLEFNNLKTALSEAPVLRMFDNLLPIVIQTDASKSGMGCCLM